MIGDSSVASGWIGSSAPSNSEIAMPKIERLFLGGFIYVYLFLVHKLIFEFFPTQKIKVYYIQVILIYIYNA